MTEAELLGLAASLEKASEHPLAEAIVRYAEEAGVEVSQATEFAAEAGRASQEWYPEEKYWQEIRK